MAPDAEPIPRAGRRSALAAAAGATVAVAVGATLVVVAAHRSTPWLATSLVPVVVISVHLAIVDIREHRLPNRVVAVLALLVSGGLVVGGLVVDDPGRAGRALGFGLVASAVFLVAHLTGGLGMGDVKYAFPATATVGWFGADAVLISAVAMLAAGAVATGAVLSTGAGTGRRVPFGPCIAAGLVVGLVAAGRVSP